MLLVPFFRGFARHLHLTCLALTAATASVFAQTNPPTAADGFDPNVDGNVYAIVTEGNGRLIVAGQFANLSPNGGETHARSNIARLNADGSMDASFAPSVNGPIRAVVLEGDGQIVIGGDFTQVGGQPHAGVARLNPDGTVDATFNAGVGTSATLPMKPQVLALALQPSDGAIIVGGSFGSASSAGGTPVARNNLVRFTASGAVDTTYNPDPNGMVLALAVHEGGRVVVGGGFTKVGTTDRSRIARLNTNGSVDTDFDPKADNGVAALAIQRDGKILLGGYFTKLQPIGTDTAVSRSRMGRLNSDGTLDTSFAPIFDAPVLAIAVAPDGSILAGGRFSTVYGAGSVSVSLPFAARLRADGSVDESFDPGFNGDVVAFAFQDDGKIVIGGYFTRAQPNSLSTQIVRNRLARVQPNGALDTPFELDAGGRILASVRQDDGRIVVAGSFTNIGGLARYYVARLNTDGSVDPDYNPDVDGRIYSLAYQRSTNQVLIGGNFTKVGTEDRRNIAKLNADGTVDANFKPTINGPISSMLVQTDNSVIVGGTFTSATSSNSTDSVARAYVLKLSNTGVVDSAFNPTLNGGVMAMAQQSDGKILVGGSFTAAQPGATGTITYRTALLRLNTDGTVDESYNPNPNPQTGASGSSVSAIAIQPADNKAIVGGQFRAFRPNNAGEPIARNFLARINPDGTIDAAFNPNPNNAVLAIGIQSDKKIVVGGLFTTFQPEGDADWTQAKYVGRLLETGKVDTSFNLDLNERLGNRVDSIAIHPGDDILIGGTFISLEPAGSGTRVLRNHFARIKPSGALDTTFDPGAGGSVEADVMAIALQTDGRIIVAGDFDDLGGASSENIARFNPEGAQDRGFNAALTTDGIVNAVAVRANGVIAPTQLAGFAWFDSDGTLRESFAPVGLRTQGSVHASLIQPDGKVIIAGGFSDLSDTVPGNIVRINPDNTIDTAFNVEVNGAVYDIARQNDGKIIIVGAFTAVNGVTRNRVARLDATTGAPDSFDPNANGTVNAVEIQSDGQVVLGGIFTTLQPNGATAVIGRNYLARVTTAGAVDANVLYNPNLNGLVNALALDDQGRVIAGGAFTTAQPNTETTPTTRNYLARFNTNGTLDTSFDPKPNDIVNALVVEPDQTIVIGGAFDQVGDEKHWSIARLQSNGSVDPEFTPGTNSTVLSIARSEDGSLLVGGYFTTVSSSGSDVPVARNRFVRFSSAGMLDPLFNPDVAGTVYDVVAGPDGSVLVGGAFDSLQPTGLILVGGNFSSIGGVPGKNLAQLNGDGSVNASFQPDLNGAIEALLPLPDGRFIVAGTFTEIAGAPRSGIARFTAEGSLDATFNPALPTGGANTLALQADGKVLVGTGSLEGLLRLNDDGSPDSSFTAAAFVPARAIAVQADGRIVVAGPGSGVPTRIARLNADGSLDSSFTQVSFPGGMDVRALTLQSDGRILVAGSFTDIGGTGISRLARLNSNGTVDTTFNPAPNGDVTALALQSDGHLLIGGTFSSVGGLQRHGLARLSNTSTAIQTLGVLEDRTTIFWNRGGTSGELAAVTFEYSEDAQDWDLLDIGTRVAGTADWQLANVSNLPADRSFYIRARGIAPTSAGKSAGVYESIRVVNFSNPIATTALPVGSVDSTVAWDRAHLVWTMDEATGIFRVADAYSGAAVDSSKTGVLGRVTTSASESSARLADLSTRGYVGPDSPLIGGFSIVGTAPRAVLIRAVGPGLAPFGVPNYLRVPQLVLFSSDGAVISQTTGWDTALTQDFARTGAFPLTPGSNDAAVVVTLAPGTYTVHVADAGGASSTGGDTLIEVYDAGSLEDGSARLVNLSSRGTVSANGTLIGGLYVSGSPSKTVLVRGVGPSLSRFGVTGVLADPRIAVYDGNGTLVVSNDDWQVSNQPMIPELDYGAAIAGAGASVSAFGFESGSKDAALVLTLPAGAYTVQVTGANGSEGAAMIEVYELP